MSEINSSQKTSEKHFKSSRSRNSNKNKNKNYKKHTNTNCHRVCFSLINNMECFNGDKCDFAHSIEQFNPKICKYDKNCKCVFTCEFCSQYSPEERNLLDLDQLIDNCKCINDCSKLHPSFETKHDLLKRLNLLPSAWKTV